MLDIIIFGAIFVFLVYLLGSVLGKRIGHEQRPGSEVPPPGSADGDNPIKGRTNLRSGKRSKVRKPDEGAEVLSFPGVLAHDSESLDDSTIAAQTTSGVLARIRIADGHFDLAEFEDVARKVFAMILDAYAQGDRESLKQFLGKELYKEFKHSISEREKNDHRLEVHLISIQDVSLKEATHDGKRAFLTLRIESEQSQAEFDANDKVISGNPNQMQKRIDLWTFSRSPGDKDPTWLLVSTDVDEPEAG